MSNGSLVESTLVVEAIDAAIENIEGDMFMIEGFPKN